MNKRNFEVDQETKRRLLHNSFLAGMLVVMLGALACQPVVVIGWRELFVIFVLIAILVGLPLYRNIRNRRDKDG